MPQSETQYVHVSGSEVSIPSANSFERTLHGTDTESLQSTTRICGLWAEGKEPFSSRTSLCYDMYSNSKQAKANLMLFVPLFWACSGVVTVNSAFTFSPNRVEGYSLPSTFICNTLAQGRKLTAKNERDVICGKTLLFFHEVITSPWVEWLAATKGLLFDWHNMPLYSTAWPHMQMTGQGGMVWWCRRKHSLNTSWV